MMMMMMRVSCIKVEVRKEDKEKEKSFCFVLKNKIREPTRFEERYSNRSPATAPESLLGIFNDCE